MRLRNNPKAIDVIYENPKLCVVSPLEDKYKIKDLFILDQPLHIEVGMGKGDFIYELARRNPHINYIGIEKYPSVLAVAINKINKFEVLDNLKVMCFDADKLLDIFNPNEIDKLYLNFSDPWPKKRHAKRRLTHENFLNIYKEILIPKGVIEFKSDNRSLIEYSIMSFNHYPLNIIDISLDLHKDGDDNNIMTEYERKFSVNGPIYKIVANFK